MGRNGTLFGDFLKRLIQGVDRKIFFIVDGNPAHKAKVVKQFVKAHIDRIKVAKWTHKWDNQMGLL